MGSAMKLETHADALRLYAITADGAARDPGAKARVRQWLQAGVRAIQLREKFLPQTDVVPFGRFLRAMTLEYNALLIVNDDARLAHLLRADGVHLGQDDMDITEAREILGQEKIVGLSTHSREQAIRAVERGADYIAVGPIFRSPTKDVGRDPLGPEFAGWAAENLGPPVVAIGGIDLKNVAQLAKAGCVNVAVISAINLGAQPAETARSILTILNSVRPGDLS